MGVKIEDIRPGDKVRGPWCTVLEVPNATYTYIRAEHDDWLGPIRTAGIVEHEPAPREIKVGDRVTWGCGTHFFTVLAVVETRAWIDSDDYPIRPLSMLRHEN